MDFIPFLLFGFLGVGALLYMIRKDRYTPCNHHNHSYEFKDFHRGGAGEMCHRVYMTCDDCGWRTCMAIRLPDHVTHTLDNTENFTRYVQ